MWCHLVLFKLKNFPDDEKVTIRQEIKSQLEKLPALIDELSDLEVGVNYELEAKSFDIALITHFEKYEDIAVYQLHQEHLKVLDLISRSAVERAAVDYEF